MECDFQCTGAANEVVEKERGNVQQQVNIFHFFNKPRVREKNAFLPKLCVLAIKLLAAWAISWLYSANGLSWCYITLW